jgi:predicted 3-demethylubiquinone-9 3-methyltransferase (glyoxalase superfamily)
MNLYTSIFPASQVENIHRYQEGEPDVPGYIAHGEFTLVNQLFIGMDSSAPHGFTFNDGVSLAVSCKDQEEVDYYWEKLALDGGQEVQCGRCKDKYGVARQIFPLQLPEALFNSDPAKAKYAMDAMMKMKKIVIDDLYMK